MKVTPFQQFVVVGIVAAFAASGCVPAAIGGAAAGGYYVGKDERSIGQIADDATITATIKAKHAKDDLVRVWDINVDTYEGVVTLYGSLPSRDAESRAISLAESTGGVRRVISKITVVSDKASQSQSYGGSYPPPPDDQFGGGL